MKTSTVLALAMPLVALFLPEFALAAAAKKCSARSTGTSGHRRHHAKTHKGQHKLVSTNLEVPQAKPKVKVTNSTTVGDIGKKKGVVGDGSIISKFGFKSSFIKKHDVVFGFLPDEGDAGGQSNTMAQLNEAYGGGQKAGIYGWYAQAHDGHFDGQQLLSRMDDIKASGAVFNPAIMPTNWVGLTEKDNSQAINIANVVKKFTDEGIETWVRFAHEMNYYQTDGTYQGGVKEFQEGWKVVSEAIRKIAPKAKMHWTPNIAGPDEYAKYFPHDASSVDLVGVDFYPKDLSISFADKMQDFHDTYAKDGRMMVVGETGLGYGGSMDDRMKWLESVMSAKERLPNLIGVAWFNFQKGYDFRVVVPGNKPKLFTSLFALS